MTLGPTNTCFDDALDMLSDAVRCNTEEIIERLHLVHGICLPPGFDGSFSHAWIEDEDGCALTMMMQDGERVAINFTPEDFQRVFNVQECTRYSVREAWAQNKKHNNFGPWEEKYLRLCRNFSEQILTKHSFNNPSLQT